MKSIDTSCAQWLFQIISPCSMLVWQLWQLGAASPTPLDVHSLDSTVIGLFVDTLAIGPLAVLWDRSIVVVYLSNRPRYREIFSIYFYLGTKWSSHTAKLLLSMGMWTHWQSSLRLPVLSKWIWPCNKHLANCCLFTPIGTISKRSIGPIEAVDVPDDSCVIWLVIVFSEKNCWLAEIFGRSICVVSCWCGCGCCNIGSFINCGCALTVGIDCIAMIWSALVGGVGPIVWTEVPARFVGCAVDH